MSAVRGRPARLPRDQVLARYRRWREMYERGLTIQEIADAEGVAQQSVRRGLALVHCERRRGGFSHVYRRTVRRLKELERENARLCARLRLLGALEAA